MKKGSSMLAEQRRKISASLLGHFVSEETRRKIGEASKGRHPVTEFKEGHPAPKTAFKKGSIPWNIGKKLPQFQGNNHRLWKGEEAGYCPKHAWVKRHKGRAENCQFCGRDYKQTRIEWANKDHKYKRNLEDYIALCSSCHKKYDYKRKRLV